mmetsp:Transcript_24673/g.62970  ORF Transcript_24673/g.62970 Transcript_24673/m.62970 type:complete len:412 (+) Transcript_24673:487-1722(+)
MMGVMRSCAATWIMIITCAGTAGWDRTRDSRLLPLLTARAILGVSFSLDFLDDSDWPISWVDLDANARESSLQGVYSVYGPPQNHAVEPGFLVGRAADPQGVSWPVTFASAPRELIKLVVLSNWGHIAALEVPVSIRRLIPNVEATWVCLEQDRHTCEQLLVFVEEQEMDISPGLRESTDFADVPWYSGSVVVAEADVVVCLDLPTCYRWSTAHPAVPLLGWDDNHWSIAIQHHSPSSQSAVDEMVEVEFTRPLAEFARRNAVEQPDGARAIVVTANPLLARAHWVLGGHVTPSVRPVAAYLDKHHFRGGSDRVIFHSSVNIKGRCIVCSMFESVFRPVAQDAGVVVVTAATHYQCAFPSLCCANCGSQVQAHSVLRLVAGSSCGAHPFRECVADVSQGDLLYGSTFVHSF